MEDLKVTASAYDFKPAQAAMQRYVDNDLLSPTTPPPTSWSR